MHSWPGFNTCTHGPIHMCTYMWTHEHSVCSVQTRRGCTGHILHSNSVVFVCSPQELLWCIHRSWTCFAFLYVFCVQKLLLGEGVRLLLLFLFLHKVLFVILFSTIEILMLTHYANITAAPRWVSPFCKWQTVFCQLSWCTADQSTSFSPWAHRMPVIYHSPLRHLSLLQHFRALVFQ